VQPVDIDLMVQEGLFIRFGETLPTMNQLHFLYDDGL
jgi:hypothetical protein